MRVRESARGDRLITAQLENIYPDMARELLGRNPSNRKITKTIVKKYADSIKNGQWEANGESIVIDEDGNLKDGQHRLQAIVMADTPATMLVVRGVSRTVNEYDRGKTRTTRDTLQMWGVSEAYATNDVAGVAKLDYYIHPQRYGTTIASDWQVRDWIEAHQEALDVAQSAMAGRSRGVSIHIAPMMLALVYAYENGIDEEICRGFANAVRTGMYEDNRYAPAILIRNDMISGRIRSQGGVMRRMAFIWISKAIHDCYTKTKRTVSYTRWKREVWGDAEGND